MTMTMPGQMVVHAASTIAGAPDGTPAVRSGGAAGRITANDGIGRRSPKAVADAPAAGAPEDGAPVVGARQPGARQPGARDAGTSDAGTSDAGTSDAGTGPQEAGTADPDGLDGLARRHGLAAVHAHWLDRHRDDRPPTRRGLEPASIAAALPNVMLADCIDDGQGPTLRFRLVGTGINGAYGMGELTRKTSRETATPADHAMIMADVARALETGRPNLRDRTVERPTDGVPVVYSRLLMPLSPVDGEPPCLLVAVDTMAARQEG